MKKYLFIALLVGVCFGQSLYSKIFKNLDQYKSKESIKNELNQLSNLYQQKTINEVEKFLKPNVKSVPIGTYLDESELVRWYEYYKDEFGVKWAHDEAKRLATRTKYKTIVNNRVFHSFNLYGNELNPIYTKIPSVYDVNKKNRFFKITKDRLKDFKIEAFIKKLEILNENQFEAVIYFSGNKKHAFKFHGIEHETKVVTGFYEIIVPKINHETYSYPNSYLPKVKLHFSSKIQSMDTLSFTLGKSFLFNESEYEKDLLKIYNKYVRREKNKEFLARVQKKIEIIKDEELNNIEKEKQDLLKKQNINKVLATYNFNQKFMEEIPFNKKEILVAELKRGSSELIKKGKINFTSMNIEVDSLVVLNDFVAFKKISSMPENFYSFTKNRFHFSFDESPVINSIEIKKRAEWKTVYQSIAYKKHIEKYGIEKKKKLKSELQKKEDRYEGKKKWGKKHGYGKMFYANGVI